MRIHVFVAVLSVFLVFTCGKPSPYITKSAVEKLTSMPVTQLKEQKRFNVAGDVELENVSVFTSGEKSVVAFFSGEKSSYRLLRAYQVPGNLVQMSFLNTGFSFSHAMLLVQKNNKDSIILIDSADFEQSFDNVQRSRVFLTKDNAGRDILMLGDISYRYNVLGYEEIHSEHPFFYWHPVVFNGDNSEIKMENRGAYTGRAIITIEFPDLKGRQIDSILALNRDISTVKLYKEGQGIHKKGGSRIASSWPMIEIIKEPFLSGGTIKLPLRLQKEAGRIQVRAVYQVNGVLWEWPAKGITGQQGYAVYEIPAP